MKKKRKVLNKEERDVLAIGGIHPPKNVQLSNAEIGQLLNYSVNRVKTIIHQACIKLKAHNRNEAIHVAIIQGEININDLLSLDEIAERFMALSPDMFRRIAHLERQGLEPACHPSKRDIIPNRDDETLLTKAERDVVILAGLGLSNKEIADKLYISPSAARIFLYRAGTKLGATRRAEAVVLAIKKGEITALDIYTADELYHILARLGPDTLDKVADIVEQKTKGLAVAANI